jgi:hypothetical protein
MRDEEPDDGRADADPGTDTRRDGDPRGTGARGGPHSDAILPFGERLDEIAQERFDRTDWIELAAAIILALATIVAAWSAYQTGDNFVLVAVAIASVNVGIWKVGNRGMVIRTGIGRPADVAGSDVRGTHVIGQRGPADVASVRGTHVTDAEWPVRAGHVRPTHTSGLTGSRRA